MSFHWLMCPTLFLDNTKMKLRKQKCYGVNKIIVGHIQLKKGGAKLSTLEKFVQDL